MSERLRVETDFSEISELYDRFAEITEDRYRGWLERILPNHSGRAVDLGCGTGQFIGLLADRYQEVLAVDASEAQLAIARRKHWRRNILFVREDMRDLHPAHDGRFDLVFSVTALHHMGDQDDVLSRVRRLVRPGGLVVVIDVVAHRPSWAADPAAYRLWRRLRTLRGGLQGLRRRGSLRDAMTMIRLRTHPAWQRICADAKPLSKEEFLLRYGRAFPGAVFEENLDPSVCAMWWQAPSI